MEDLETYINDNNALFSEEPSEGHFGRFEQKLQERKTHKRRRLIRSTMRVASVAALMIMSGMYVSSRFFSEDVEQVSYVHQEFMEAQFYYKTQISKGINSIKTIDGGLDAQQRVQLVDEMSTADAYFEELQEDFKATPDDPRVIEAMLHHYKTKAMIINSIVNDLEKINTTKKENNTSVAL
ncbi:MAG: hypothetical protein PF444_07520 [Bacteroidales bacterium]|jgi:hypothetical protein|nr:hypothetical protein [Bacteroidales bacterium]